MIGGNTNFEIHENFSNYIFLIKRPEHQLQLYQLGASIIEKTKI